MGGFSQEEAMGEKQELDVNSVRLAIKKLAEHKFHGRLKGVDGSESHRILPEIWPVIQELCMIADAAEAKMIFVKSSNPRRIRTKTQQLTFTSIRRHTSLSEEQTRELFRAMDHPDAPTRQLVETRRKYE